jgi:hypothetical protein
MLLRTKCLDVNDKETNVSINVMNIVSLDPVNSHNLDGGTNIYLRDGRSYVCPLPIYTLSVDIEKVMEKYSGAIMVSFLSEYFKKATPKKRATKSK